MLINMCALHSKLLLMIIFVSFQGGSGNFINDLVMTPLRLFDVAISGLEDVYLATISHLDINMTYYKSPDVTKPVSLGALTDAKKLFIIIHGVEEAPQWPKFLTHKLFQYVPQSIVSHLNWQEFSSLTYYRASRYAIQVGGLLGEIIRDFKITYNVSEKDVILIGYNMGAHLAAFAAKRYHELTKRKLRKILALAPSSHIFTTKPSDEKLSKTDAEIVHVIHTDDNLIGYNIEGSLDFYPNGGVYQPGCNSSEKYDFFDIARTDSCNGVRSLEYLVEGVGKPESFLSVRCDSYKTFRAGGCKSKKIQSMTDVLANGVGKFYLSTNAAAPFSISN